MLSINKYTLLAFAGTVIITACKVNKNQSSTKNNIQNAVVAPVSIKPMVKGPYREAAPRVVDIEHMSLAVNFNYQKQHVLGNAVLTCKPYYYALNKAEFDARGFDIKQVGLLKNSDTILLKYTYQNDKLLVFLDTTYTRKQVFKVWVDYTAKPNEIKGLKGKAITDDKGLYFINPLGTDSTKPRQIWTQGETQSNSCWFPTNDVPNEKITQDLAITVDDKDITLSNGELMRSKMNADGTRTDFWRQTKPHAPYLVMLAVGEFAKVKDYWRDSVEVDYYVEPAFKKHAKMVFGNTPEMMEVYSKRLGVDYPWDKYSQIVVRDFVSGAMENTSAVIHFEGLQHDAREHLDNTHEDVVAHELFHHWFGDLVTSESWSNIPLNESFATYGEYIWHEAKYGLMEADCEFNNNLTAYLGQKNKHKVEPIRYHYQSRDDMFDVVSYQKGGAMLHMLRKLIGDDAFFEALKLYLTKNAYKPAELAHLRLAFEEVTGQDLNWFFNQWFLKAGHPILDIKYQYNTDRTSVTVNIKQKQDSSWGVYRLPVNVDVYTDAGIVKQAAVFNALTSELVINSASPIKFVNIDADKALVAAITDNKSAEECKAQLRLAPLFMDKSYAVKAWLEVLPDSLTASDVEAVNYLLAHEFWGVRKLGLKVIESLKEEDEKRFANQLAKLVIADSKPINRSTALMILAEQKDAQNMQLFKQALNDSAYSVVASAIDAVALNDSAEALVLAQQHKTTANWRVQQSVMNIIVSYATTNEVSYFEMLMRKYANRKYPIMNSYVQYLQMADMATQKQAVEGLKQIRTNMADEHFVGLLPNWINYLKAPWRDRIALLNEQALKAKKNATELADIANKKAIAQQMIDAYESILK